MTITYHLRKNARWSDGVPVTARDVKWSWQAIMNPDNNVVSRHGYDVIDRSTRPTTTPSSCISRAASRRSSTPSLPKATSRTCRAPAHVLSRYPNINNIPFNSAPTVSNGPFKFEQWARGDHISVVRNDAFFMGRPGLARIEVKIIPDEDTSVNLLRTHGIDYMFQASIQTYEQVRTIPDVRIAWVNVNGYDALQMNLSRPLLRDQHVTSAIAYAVDKNEMVRTLTYGTQRRSDGRHSGLDVGVQSGRTFVSARSGGWRERCCARPDGGRGPTASCAKAGISSLW